MNLDDEDVRNYLLDSDNTDEDSDFIPENGEGSSSGQTFRLFNYECLENKQF